MFSKALLLSTYKNGMPGQLTEAHKKAEYHRFKTEFLFKDKAIPKELYVSRLIQHYLIIKAIETQLQTLSESAKEGINVFFALTFLAELWRTPEIEKDLQLLDKNPQDILDHEIATATKAYIKNLEQLGPKALLTHFLTHVAGFMHGGNVIISKYINPSNQLTPYQIPANQYNFQEAASFLPTDSPSPRDVYTIMMKRADKIEISDDEYEDILRECKNVYEMMTNIYDDLCDMQMKQPQITSNSQSLGPLFCKIICCVLLFCFIRELFNPNILDLPVP